MNWQMPEYITAKEAGASHFGTQVPANTVRKWMRIGVQDRRMKHLRHDDLTCDGSVSHAPRIRLKHIREGGICLTTAEWVQEFKAACLQNRSTK